MRIAAVGDVHGRENLPAFAEDLAKLPAPDVFLLAGDVTDRSDLDGFAAVAEALAARVRCPVYAVFGNNEYADDHPRYRERFPFRFLDDEAVALEVGGREIRLVGSTGSLDRPTWWQRKNVPGIAQLYEERVARVDRLLAGDGPRILLTHYPPTHATMGGEKEEWRPELGSLKLEGVVLRRRPDVVIHGHVHKGIPRAEIGGGQRAIEDFGSRPLIPVYNVAYPVTRGITVIEV